MLELFQLLGQSYGLSQVKANASGAVALLRDAIADSSELRAQAEDHRVRLAAVLAARGDACHVTRVSHDLLHAALIGPKE